jgi:Xaa-Pro aminopeptidase
MKSFETDICRVPYDWEHRRKYLELDFPVEEFQDRVRAVQAAMARDGYEHLVIYGGGSSQVNVRYLTGLNLLWGFVFVVLPASGEPIVVTDAVFHGEPMHSNFQTAWVEDIRVVPNVGMTTATLEGITACLRAALADAGWTESSSTAMAGADSLPVGLHRTLADWLGHADDWGAPLMTLRAIKSPREIEKMRHVAAASSAAMDAALTAVSEGVPEHQLAAIAHEVGMGAGLDEMGPGGALVAAGRRSFMRNVPPLKFRPLVAGEAVSIDITAKFDGYQSDMARNTVVGSPTKELTRLFDACVAAQDAGLEQVRPGVSVNTVVDAMSKVVADEGYAEWDWSTAHGGGLSLLEMPHFVAGNARPLEAGMTFYIEPMICVTELAGACTEDMVLVTEDGWELLTTSPRRWW